MTNFTFISEFHDLLSGQDLRGNLYLKIGDYPHFVLLRKNHAQLLYKEKIEAMERYRSRMMDYRNSSEHYFKVWSAQCQDNLKLSQEIEDIKDLSKAFDEMDKDLRT